MENMGTSLTTVNAFALFQSSKANIFFFLTKENVSISTVLIILILTLTIRLQSSTLSFFVWYVL